MRTYDTCIPANRAITRGVSPRVAGLVTES
jgi:hypothetical protein